MSKFQRSLLIVCVLSAFGFMMAVAFVSTAAAQSAPDAVQDTPQPILTFSEDISEWRMTSGFIYLTDTCTDFSAQTTAYIRRRAIYSTILSTLESIDGAPQCRTFRHAAVDESGIYYYNRNLGRLEAIYSDRPTDPPTPLATIGDWTRIGFGDGISALRLHGAYVYWIEVKLNGEFNPDDITIKRVSKNGGTPTTLISYSTASQASFEGLGVTSAYVWWTDSDGLNRISSCILQPCLPGPVVKTVEFPISSGEGNIQVSGSSVFWWNGDENPVKIRRTSCSFLGGNCSTSTLHTVSNGARVVGLAANSEAAFWTEDVPLVGRRLRRQALSGGAAETLAENIHLAAPYLDVDGVYFQTDIRTISRLRFDAAAITREIGINGLEVTQGMQRLANDVPLVAGKATYVRLYPTLEDGANAGAITAELHGSRNNQPLPGSPIYPLNVTIPVAASLSLANRVALDGGWLFLLPESWTRTGDGLIPQADTTITLRAVIDPDGAYADSDSPGNNEIEGDFLFTAKAPTCMTMRPVTTDGSYQPVYGFNIGQVIKLTESVLPTPKLIAFPKNDPLREIDWCWKGPVYGPFCSTPYELSDDDSGLLTKMGWLDYWADSPSICFSNNARTLYAGIIHKDATWDWSGLARRGKDQLLTKVPAYGDAISRFSGLAMTMVHEIGHSYGRRHVDCGDPLNPDSNYPYPTDMLDFNLSLDHPDLHFGFDPLLQRPINPIVTKDFNSYCGPKWYSDYTWKAIFNNTRDPIFVPPPTLSSAAGDLVRVAGLIDADSNSGTLDYAWMLPVSETSNSQREKWSATLTPAWNDRSANAAYHLQLIGTGGRILADQVIELTDVEDGDQDGPEPFELALAAPGAPVARLQLMQGESVLAVLAPGATQPTVAINQPAGGATVNEEITIGWTAADPDGDQLQYTIQYSSNGGGEWFPLLVNYGGAGGVSETLTLDLSAEAGSDGANALVRVLASDGYNTTVATSQPFTVAKRGPFVAITNPAVGQTFAASEVIPLRSFATDPEDGLIADSQFVWSTGRIGQTAEVRGLAPGAHTIQLSVTDADGLNGTHSVSFDVAPLAVPETSDSFALDGRCDDTGYQNAPQLPLAPYADDSRASAQIIRTGGSLWLCLTGLQAVDGYAGLLLDADNSGDASVQNGDFGYFVQQDGTRFVREGDGSGFGSASADDLSARVFDHGAAWSAELRIRKSAFGRWQKRVSLAIGHFEQTGNGDTVWPRSVDKLSAEMTSPQSWAQTNLGLMGALTAVAPQSSVLGAGDIALTVSGANFDGDNRVLWNGISVATTLVDANTLTAVVPANLVTVAGTAEVSVGVDAVDDLVTAALPFTVRNPQPAIANLTPDTAEANSGGMTLTVNGSDFVDGAMVVWNGETRVATFVSPAQLRVDLTDADLADDGAIPVVVLNPEPGVGPSNTVVFVISAEGRQIFLPLIER